MHGMSDMMRRDIQRERMFVPQLPEQADAREIVFHFKIQTCPSKKKILLYLVRPGGSLGLPTRAFTMTLSLIMTSWETDVYRLRSMAADHLYTLTFTNAQTHHEGALCL